MSKVPDWVIPVLGASVSFTRQIELGGRIYSRGDSATLVSIQSGWPHAVEPYATVALDPQDWSYEENVPFDAIEPQRQ